MFVESEFECEQMCAKDITTARASSVFPEKACCALARVGARVRSLAPHAPGGLGGAVRIRPARGESSAHVPQQCLRLSGRPSPGAVRSGLQPGWSWCVCAACVNARKFRIARVYSSCANSAYKLGALLIAQLRLGSASACLFRHASEFVGQPSPSSDAACFIMAALTWC